MAGFSNTTEDAILNLIYRATAWANYANNAAGTPEANIIVSLQTADPGDTGTMSASEAAYTNYARQNVARSTGWTASAGTGSVALAANLDFPSSGAAGTTITNFATGKSGGGATAILMTGAVSPTIPIGGAGVVPRLTTATTCSLD